MKKLLAIALATIVAFTSCNRSYDIVGTSWVADISGDNTAIVEFTTETVCKETVYFNGKLVSLNGVYVYNAPDVFMSFPQDHLNLSGTIVDKNNMILTLEGKMMFYKRKKK